MCGPAVVPIATLVISAVATGYDMMQQNRLASAQEAAARNAYNADMQQLELQAEQTNDEATLEKLERQRQAAREQSRIIASISEVGGLGGSFLSMMANSRLQAGYDTGIMEKNRVNAIQQNKTYQKSIGATYQSRMNEAGSRRVSPFMAGLQIAGYAANSYGQYSTNKKSGVY